MRQARIRNARGWHQRTTAAKRSRARGWVPASSDPIANMSLRHQDSTHAAVETARPVILGPGEHLPHRAPHRVRRTPCADTRNHALTAAFVVRRARITRRQVWLKSSRSKASAVPGGRSTSGEDAGQHGVRIRAGPRRAPAGPKPGDAENRRAAASAPMPTDGTATRMNATSASPSTLSSGRASGPRAPERIEARTQRLEDDDLGRDAIPARHERGEPGGAAYQRDRDERAEPAGLASKGMAIAPRTGHDEDEAMTRPCQPTTKSGHTSARRARGLRGLASRPR